jgi:hypothetical protein
MVSQSFGEKTVAKLKAISEVTNGAKAAIEFGLPYAVQLTLRGTSDLLMHRWNVQAVEEKASAAKNSFAKKTDDLESYVWRNEEGDICLPGEYIRQSIITAAKFKQDPRSPRKSASDLFKAGVVSLTQMASFGMKEWQYVDTRRVMIQRQGVNRSRPAIKSGWEAQFVFYVLTPEYISPELLLEVTNMAGRLVGTADFRPTFGRFQVVEFKLLEDNKP